MIGGESKMIVPKRMLAAGKLERKERGTGSMTVRKKVLMGTALEEEEQVHEPYDIPSFSQTATNREDVTKRDTSFDDITTGIVLIFLLGGVLLLIGATALDFWRILQDVLHTFVSWDATTFNIVVMHAVAFFATLFIEMLRITMVLLICALIMLVVSMPFKIIHNIAEGLSEYNRPRNQRRGREPTHSASSGFMGEIVPSILTGILLGRMLRRRR